MLKKLLLVAVSSALSLLAAEGFVRLVQPQDMVTNTSWYQADPRYFFRHRGNLDRQMRWGEFYHLRTNSQGLREDREIPFDPGGRYRVIVHGDSFTFGNGVERPATFVAQAEDYLHQHGHAEAEVVNFGVSAHGPDLEYLYYQAEGKKYHPRIVVVAAYLGNDVTDVVKFQGFQLVGDRLVPKTFTISWMKKATDLGIYRFFINHSHFLVLLRNRFAASRTAEARTFSDVDKFPERIAMALRIWSAFLDEIRADGAMPLLLLMPTREQIYAFRGQPLAEDPYLIAEPARQALLQACVEKGWDCLDVLPKMAAAPGNPDDLFIRDLVTGKVDFHFNARGHRVVGQALGERLQAMMEASAPAPPP